MEKEFKAGMQYSGEMIYGCSGNMDTNNITVIKREGQHITYRQDFGLENGQIREVPVEMDDKWGEYISIGDDRFFAYAVKAA